MVLDRGSSKHGAWSDDLLAGEVEGLIRSGHDTRAEEWRLAEPPLDDDLAGSLAPPMDPLAAAGPGAARGAGTAQSETAHPGPAAMSPRDVAERSELARRLDRSVFPGHPPAIARDLRERNAPDRFVTAVESLPATMTVGNLGELWRAIHDGGHAESRRF